MELSAKYDPSQVEDNGTPIGLKTSSFIQNRMKGNLIR